MTHLEIVNRALVAAGANPKENFDNINDNEVTSVRAFYESAWREVLSSHPWTELTHEETMSGIPDGDDYAYPIPETCIRVVSVHSSGQNPIHVRRGREIITPFDNIVLRYVSTEGILPVDWDFMDIEILTPIPPSVDEAVSLKLASQIAFRITQNQAVQMHLHERYTLALREAKMSDMTTDGGERLWTE